MPFIYNVFSSIDSDPVFLQNFRNIKGVLCTKMRFRCRNICKFDMFLKTWPAYLRDLARHFKTKPSTVCPVSIYSQTSGTKRRPDRKELIKIISTRYLWISLITRKYLVDMILINLSGRGHKKNWTFFSKL
jgi:hypothetical protein